LRKNSEDLLPRSVALKGLGFSRAATVLFSITPLAAEVQRWEAPDFFRNLFSRADATLKRSGLQPLRFARSGTDTAIH
jgi:hypothetical protein